jgi:hypothetical protein
MGLFSNILEKLGLKKKAEEEKPAAPAAAAADTKPAAPAAKPAAPAPKAAASAGVKSSGIKRDDADVSAPAPAALTVVDVVAQLEERAKGKEPKAPCGLLNCSNSTAAVAREELAKELNCPADQMSDSARMNVWLHKEVLRQIAANGGNIPKDLLD